MNRADKRKIVKQGITAEQLNVITAHNVNTGIKQGREDGMTIGLNMAVDTYSVAIAYVMHYKMNYGEKKTIATMKQIQEVFAELSNGTKDLKTMKEELLNDIGLSFK